MTCRAGEVSIDIVATGICHTDTAMRDALLPVPRPVVLEHEGAGIMLAVGEDVSHVAPARNVVRVPADLPLDLMGPLGCGFLTGADAVLKSLNLQPGTASR